jgi:hypothetical protein
VIRGTACNKDDATSAANDLGKATETAKGDLMVFEIDTTTHGVDNRFRLFIDFLLHKVIKGALHDFSKFDFQGLNGTSSRRGVFLGATDTMDVEF